LTNFGDNRDDEGEIWFGEDALYRVMAWFDRNTELVPPEKAAILDLGCGNGITCVQFACEGYADVTGVDYCADAIKLAEKVAAQRDVADKIKFEVCDILAPYSGSPPTLAKRYDVLFDKGTYDAVSLDPAGAKAQRAKYMDNVYGLLKNGAILVITSCNWTKDELISHFEKCKYTSNNFNVDEH
jgi:cyclopropane fatty-acyl-phospholipid synthase-like methyltransferase